MFDKIWILY